MFKDLIDIDLVILKDRKHGDKSYLSQFTELLWWRIVCSEVLKYYNCYGFNRKGSSKRDYLSLKSYRCIREKINSKLIDKDAGYSYLTLTADKFVTNTMLTGLGIRCIPVQALIKGGNVLVGAHTESTTITDYIKELEGDFYFKRIIGDCGRGIYKFTFSNGNVMTEAEYGSWDLVQSYLQSGIWIVQQKAYPHEAYKFFSENSSNTLRINTILVKGIPQHYLSFQKLSMSNRDLDNWDFGSVLVGVDSSKGTLLKHGYMKPNQNQNYMIDRHPESKKEFADWVIPYYREAVEMCINAHHYFYGRFIVGWDLVISDDGPKILEANSYPDIHPLQVLYGGQKKEFTRIARSNLV